MPRALVESAWSQQRGDWLSSVPRAIAHLESVWSIEVGEPFQPGGQTAWVGPATRGGDDGFVLKIGWRHPEGEHEADGLRLWDGDGAVRLYAAEVVDDETLAFLLERCRPGTTLKERPEEEQDIVVAQLLQRLWTRSPRGHPFRPLQSMCEWWADESEQKIAAARPSGLDPGLVRAGLTLFRELPNSAEREVLLCTDLHGDNILAAEREPWLAIDPKPYVGDPTYDALQHMLNCKARLQSDPRAFAHRMAGLLDLDPDRLMLWLFARCVQESPHWPSLAPVARQIVPK
jgi:streptomycin 6-kinase